MRGKLIRDFYARLALPLLLLLVGILLFSARAGSAAVKTWDGSANGNWSTAANWSGDTAPVAGDELLFPLGSVRTNMTNNFNPLRAFTSITFVGSNYNVRGGLLILSNGLRMGVVGTANNLPPTPNDIFNDIELRGAQPFVSSNMFTRLTLHGDLILGPHTITLSGDGNIRVFGTISGSGSVIKEGSGLSELESNNTFTGSVTIREGRLRAKEPFSLGTPDGGTFVESATLETWTSVTNEPLFLNGATFFNNIHPGFWNGPISLVNTCSFLVAGRLTVDGVIEGSGSLRLSMFTQLDSECVLAGASDNTYTGKTVLEQGILTLQKLAPAVAINTGPIQVGDGIGPAAEAVIRYRNGNQIGDSEITVQADGVIDLNGESDAIGGLSMIGGVVTNTGTGTLQLGGNITAASADGVPARIFGGLALGPATLALYVTNSPDTETELEIHGQISGPSGLIKDGSGLLSLMASNNYSGETLVNAGVLEINNSFALGGLPGATIVKDGATLGLLPGAEIVFESFTLSGNGDAGAGVLRSRGTNVCAGEIALTSDSLINVLSGSFNLGGAISGPGGLTKVGPGTLVFSGSTDNSHAGVTHVRSGVLELSKSNAFAVRGAQLIIGDAADGNAADIVRYNSGNQLHSAVDIVIHRTGLLDLNGFTDDVGDISLAGGSIQTGNGVLQLLGNVTAVSSTAGSASDPAHITGHLDLGATGTRMFTVNDNSFLHGVPVDLIVDAIISGGANWIKIGSGEMQLGAANSFVGAVMVLAGELVVANSLALGTSAGGVLVTNGSTLRLTGGATVANESLVLHSGPSSPGILLSTENTNAWNGPIVLATTAVVNVGTNSGLNLGGVISGPGGLTKTGFGALSFFGADGDNTYQGVTTVLCGLMRVNRDWGVTGSFLVIPGDLTIGRAAPSVESSTVRFEGCCAISSAAHVRLFPAGILDVNGAAVTVASLEGYGVVNLGTVTHGSALPGLTVGQDSPDLDAFHGLITGTAGHFTKAGTNRLILTATNTYTAPTFVSGGQLEVNGAQTGSAVTVRTNATLTGRGSVGDLTVATGGNLRPGIGPGRLMVGNTVLSNEAVLHIELNGVVVGTGYDQLDVTGSLELAGAQLATSLGALVPYAGQTINIINNDSSDGITGTFKLLPNDSPLNIGGLSFRIRYDGGSGSNDVILVAESQGLDPVGASITTGNGNGTVDRNECNLLYLVVSNTTPASISNVTAFLSTATPGVIVTEPYSAYGFIASQRAVTNSAPFQFFTTPSFTCGGSIEFLLTVAPQDKPQFSLRYFVQSGQVQPAVTFSNDTVMPLVDGAIVSSPITVGGITGSLAKVTVSLVIDHPSLSDLHISLVAPGGQSVPLASSLFGTQLGTDCGNGRAVFDDDAASSVIAAAPPYLGVWRPVSPMAGLAGRTDDLINGSWQLQILDASSNALEGTLFCWSLSLTPALCVDGGGPCAICNGPFFGAIMTNDPPVTTFTDGLRTTNCTFDPCTGLFVTAPMSWPTDVYMFTNSGGPTCMTVTVDAPCANPTNVLVSSVVLQGTPTTNACLNLLGFSGRIASSVARYSFLAPAGARLAVTVSGASPGFGLCQDYAVRVDGFDCPVSLGIERDLNPSRTILSWPTFGAEMKLQGITVLSLMNWVTLTNEPIARDGRFVLTNDIAGPQRFYRLRKQ